MTTDDLLGRRYEPTDTDSLLGDFTVVAVDPQKQQVRLHFLDGRRQWALLTSLEKAISRGLVRESDQAPFVFSRETHGHTHTQAPTMGRQTRRRRT